MKYFTINRHFLKLTNLQESCGSWSFFLTSPVRLPTQKLDFYWIDTAGQELCVELYTLLNVWKSAVDTWWRQQKTDLVGLCRVSSKPLTQLRQASVNKGKKFSPFVVRGRTVLSAGTLQRFICLDVTRGIGISSPRTSLALRSMSAVAAFMTKFPKWTVKKQ